MFLLGGDTLENLRRALLSVSAPQLSFNQATADFLLSLSSRLKCVGRRGRGVGKGILCHLEQGRWLRKHPAIEQRWALGEQTEHWGSE